MEVYVRRGGEQFGPFTPEQVEESFATGAIVESDLVWHSGFSDWMPVNEVLGTLQSRGNSANETVSVGGDRKKTILAVVASVVVLGVVAVFLLPRVFSSDENKTLATPSSGKIAEGTVVTTGEQVIPQASLGITTNKTTEPDGLPPKPEELLKGVATDKTTEPEGVPPKPEELLPKPPQIAPVLKGDTKTLFTAVTEHLDEDGTFYSYLSTQQAQDWANKIFVDGEGWMREFGFTPVQVPVGAKSIKQGRGLEQAVYRGLGLNSINGLGASSREIGDGLKRNVAVVHHDPAHGDGLIWQAFGNAPHELLGLKLMPDETAFAMHGDLDLITILAWAKKMFKAYAGKEFRGEFDKNSQKATFQTVLDSYGGELGIFVTLDPIKTIEVPSGMGVFGFLGSATSEPSAKEITAHFPRAEPIIPALGTGDSKDKSPPASKSVVKIPEPGFVFTIKVRDDGLQRMLQDLVSGQRLPLQLEESAGIPIHQLAKPMPLDWPFPVQPAMFQVGNYLVITSTPVLAAKVAAVHQGKAPRLVDSPEFKKLAKDIPVKGNQFGYFSERLAQLHSVMARREPETSEVGKMPDPLIELMTASISAQVSVLQVTSEGFVLKTHTRGLGYDSSVLMAGAGVVPVVMGVFLAVPALLGVPDELGAEHRDNEVAKLSQGRVLADGFMQVKQANGHLPNAETWSDDLLKIVRDPKHFVEPVMVDPLKPNEKICTWLFNRHLGGMKPTDLSDPKNTVLLFAAESLEWNGAGDDRDFPVDVGDVITVFADGHVTSISKADLSRLKWKP